MTACCFSESFESSRCVMAAKDGVLIRRRRRIFAAAVALVLLCAVFVGGVSGADTSWIDRADTSWYDASAASYTITTAEQLAGVSKLVYDAYRMAGTTDFAEKTIYLGADIDLSGHRWVAIGVSGGFFGNCPFKGTFDGQGYTISNLTQTIGRNDEGGLFGHVSSGGIIKNVTLENVDIIIGVTGTSLTGASGATVGSLVSVLDGGSVTDCTISDVNIVPTEGYDDYSGGSLSDIITVGDVVGNVKGEGTVSDITCTNIAVTVDEFTKYSAAISNNDHTVKFIYNNNQYASEEETKTAKYTVSIYMMDSNGDYPHVPTLNLESYELIGVTINAATVYPVPEGYVIDQDNSTLSGTVTEDGTLVLSVYYALSLQTSVTYTITIPNSLEVSGDTKNGEMTITAEGVQIPDTDWLSILVASENDFFFVHSTADSVKLKYSLMVSDSSQVIVNNQEIMRITQSEYQANGSGSLQTVLRAQVTATPQYAGLYTDTLTFTVKYESQ